MNNYACQRHLAIAALALAATGNALAQNNATAAVTTGDAYAQFARPGQLVDIGGRRLNLHCSGAGPVTVIFDSPSGEPGLSWFKVQPRIAQRTRACLYDRAGLGFSDPSPRPGTVGNAADDLHALLGAAGIAPPYILVGNSYGGATAQVYAYRYPDQVKGLVLVEPYHEEQSARSSAATGGKSDQMRAMGEQMEKDCAEQAARGFVPGSEALANCTGGLERQFGRSLAAVQFANRTSAAQWRARLSEESHFSVSDGELRALRGPFGDLPVLVLTRSISPFAIPGKPQSALNKALEDANLQLNGEIAALSRRGKLTRVAGAGHIIQYDQPGAVIAAVEEMLVEPGR